MLRQLSQGVIKEIEIEALGDLAKKNIEGLKLAILKGVLSYNLDSVTFVNAPLIAKERGIKVKELKSDDSGAYKDKLRIKLVTETETRVIAGTVLQENIPAIIQIDAYPVNIKPENHSIITYHEDKPGIVAQISKILWDANVNISSLNLGRTQDSASAVMVVNVDSSVDDEILKNIENIKGISLAKYVRLKGKIAT
jgi:D-3-phosphoglycerate dehydrogenase